VRQVLLHLILALLCLAKPTIQSAAFFVLGLFADRWRSNCSSPSMIPPEGSTTLSNETRRCGSTVKDTSGTPLPWLQKEDVASIFALLQRMGSSTWYR
jgi:hypothetical protein